MIGQEAVKFGEQGGQGERLRRKIFAHPEEMLERAGDPGTFGVIQVQVCQEMYPVAQRIDLESVVHRVHDIGGRAISYKKVESVIACGRLGFDKLESLKGRPALQDIEAQETARAAARVRGLFGVPVQYPGKETVFVDPQPGAPGKDVLPAVDSRSVPELSRW